MWSAEQRLKIIVAAEEMLQVAVGNRRHPAERFAKPGKAVDYPGGDEQQTGGIERHRVTVGAHGPAAFADQDDMVEIAMDVRLDRPFAGPRSIVEAFHMDKAGFDCPLRLTIEVEGRNGCAHDAQKLLDRPIYMLA